MWIFGEDVARPSPDTTHVIHALESLEFLSARDIFETETTKFADVDPARPRRSSRRSGTFINAERRFQSVAAALEPAGSAKTDLRDHHLDLGPRWGTTHGLASPVEAMDEIRALTPEYAGRQPRTRIGRTGLQWPGAPDGTDSPILTSGSSVARRAGRDSPGVPYKVPGDSVDGGSR